MPRPLSLALQEYAVEWQRLPWPIEWTEVFGREAPLALEIGFGNGAFLAEEAAARPERDHVGLELSWTAATHLFRRLSRAELANVRVVLGDAEALVEKLFAPGSLCAVSVNHPSPWPKARHEGRRLLRRDFVEALAERMQPGAKLTVLTDHAGHAAWLEQELAAQRALVSCHPTASVPVPAGRMPTKYQLRALAQGLALHFFEWRKLDSAPRGPCPPRERPEMPTLTLKGYAGAEPFQGFHPALFRERNQGVEVVVKLEAVYRRTEMPAWLLEVLVQEDRLRQQFGIDVVARGSTLLLKPSVLGEPYPTHGVKRAVWCAAQWLRRAHPGLEVQHESLGIAPPQEPWPPE